MDASGYAFWVDQVLALDRINPTIAARIARALDRWRKFTPDRQTAMRAALEEIARTARAFARRLRDRQQGACALTCTDEAVTHALPDSLRARAWHRFGSAAAARNRRARVQDDQSCGRQGCTGQRAGQREHDQHSRARRKRSSTYCRTRYCSRPVAGAAYLAGMASEEMDAPMGIPVAYPRGKYLLLFDPLDGSSNIDVNVSIGTIFSVLPGPSMAKTPAKPRFCSGAAVRCVRVIRSTARRHCWC